MSTLFFPSSSIIIKRQHAQGNNKYTYSATFTAYQADIQPAGPNRTEQNFGRIGLVFDAFVGTDVPVREGDRLVSDGKTYSVKAVQTWPGAGLLDHRQLVLVAQDGS